MAIDFFYWISIVSNIELHANKVMRIRLYTPPTKNKIEDHTNGKNSSNREAELFVCIEHNLVEIEIGRMK